MIRFLEYLNEWSIRMPPKGSGIGIARKDMPQIEHKDYKAYVRYLETHSVTLKKELVDPDTLKATQKEFSKDGVVRSIEKLADTIKSRTEDKPIIVSRDGYVIDGHHRWIAYQNVGLKMSALRASADAETLLDLTRQFPKVIYKEHGTNKVLKK